MMVMRGELYDCVRPLIRGTALSFVLVLVGYGG